MSGFLARSISFDHTHMTRGSLSIPGPVFQAAEQLAQQLSVSRSELYARAVLAYVQSHHDDHITARLDELYSSEDSSLDPIIHQMQVGSLPPLPF